MKARLRQWWREQVCSALGHDVDETTAHMHGETLIVAGCLRCDKTLDVREFKGLYPLPRQEKTAHG